MGDGVLVYFGYPQAHEDDAEQAVRAGLALVDAVAKLSTDTDAALSARIGIATGVTVVGDLTGEGAAQERAAIGETPNLAARLQTLAEPGTVLICRTRAGSLGGTSIIAISGPHAERLGGASIGLAGAGDERRGEPLRGDAQDQAAAAVRA